MAPTELNSPIEHVVMLMLENHSFDQMLGCLCESGVHQDLDGVPADLDRRRSNQDSRGNWYRQSASVDFQTKLDPPHETSAVIRSLEQGNAGFVRIRAKVSKMHQC